MSEKQNTSEVSVTRFELKANNAVRELIIGKIFRGEKGEKGEAGYTPVKGVDYWTPSEEAVIEAAKVAANDAAANADKTAADAIAKVDKAIEDIQINWDSKQDKLSAENPVQAEQIADNAVSASKLSAEVATAVGKIPQLEEGVSVNNTSIENLGADVQELRENLQEKQDALSVENPVQAEQIADGSITLKKLGADVATRLVEYLPTINDFDEVVGSDVGWKKEDMQRAAQICASGRVGVSIYDAGGNLPMILINASDDLEDIGSCFAVLEYHSVLISGHVESIYMRLDYKEATNKTTVTQFTHLTRLVPRNFVTDDTLNYVQDEPDTDNDTLGVAKGSISKEYLSPELQEAVKPLLLPSLEYPAEFEGASEVSEWTAADYQKCVDSLGLESGTPFYIQVIIDNELFNPVSYVEETEEAPTHLIFGCISGQITKPVYTTVSMFLQNNKVMWGEKSVMAINPCINEIIETETANRKLVGFSGTFDDFAADFNTSADIFVHGGGSLTVIGPWFDVAKQEALTAIYKDCGIDDVEKKTVFTDGSNVVTVTIVYNGDGEVKITSKSLLTEGSAPSMAQYNALNAKIGDIDSVLTAIMGE